MTRSPKVRIDKLLVDQGFAESRAKAQAMIMAGNVLVGESRVEKPSESFKADDPIRIKGVSDATRYVGRGGLKLEAALKAFSIDPSGLVCIDVGSSTGGFTDCLLQHGAARVVAVDAGTNQLVWSLRTDPRVEVKENTNARHLIPTDFETKFDLAVMDVSFISVTKVIPAILDLLTAEKRLVVLIKPQFEVGKGEVGKGGIVRDDDKRERVLADVNSFAESLGLFCNGSIESPISGAQGNREYLSYYSEEAPD